MKNPVQLTKPIRPIRKSLNRSPWRRGFLLIMLALGFACFALSPTARAVDPPPDGGYPNDNTAIGAAALFSNTEGRDNTANGAFALYSNTGSGNTATGALAMEANTTG